MEQDTQQGASANLQSLLERIRREGTDRAEAEAKTIVERASRKADDLVRQAEARAEALRRESAEEAEKNAAQGRRALELAARDVVLAVGNAVQETLDRIVRADVGQAMKGEAFRAMVAGVVEAYAAKLPAETGIELLVPESEREALARALQARFSEAARGGLDIRSDKSVVAGFRVSAKGSSVEHDFTAGAVAEAICRLVRPRLAERVRAAVPTGGPAR
jgi:V/A-type H+-transporting ATPase subunit E